jgi:FG-GAP-like repeat
MSLQSWLQKFRSTLTPGRGHARRRSSLRAGARRPRLEALEDRLTPSLTYAGLTLVPISTITAVAIADSSNDGHLDVLTGSWIGPAADYNNDGNIDSVYPSGALNGWASIEVVLSDGQGGVLARHQYQVHATSVSGVNEMAGADLNADGRPDVVTHNSNEGTVSVLLGNGDGTLSYDFDASNFAVGSYTHGVAVGDCTRDGIPDIVTTSFVYQTLIVLPGRGDGTFGPRMVSQGAPFRDSELWSAADLNGDRLLDVITHSSTFDHGGSWVNVSLSRGDGTFGPPQQFHEGPHQLRFTTASATGDLDEDGRPDVVVAGAFGDDDGAYVVLHNDYDWGPRRRRRRRPRRQPRPISGSTT